MAKRRWTAAFGMLEFSVALVSGVRGKPIHPELRLGAMEEGDMRW